MLRIRVKFDTPNIRVEQKICFETMTKGAIGVVKQLEEQLGEPQVLQPGVPPEEQLGVPPEEQLGVQPGE